MREQGIVLEINDGRVLVQVQPGEGCGETCSCSAVEGTAGLRRVELDAPEDVRVGSRVTLEVSSGQVLASSTAVFLGPPAMFVLGAAVSKPVLGALGVHINPDVGMMVCGAVGFVIGLAGALLFSRRGTKRNWLKPRIVEVVNSPAAPPLDG